MNGQNINVILQTMYLKWRDNTFVQIINMTKPSDQTVQIDPNVEREEDDTKSSVGSIKNKFMGAQISYKGDQNIQHEQVYKEIY